MPKLTIAADGYHMDDGFMGVRNGQVLITHAWLKNDSLSVCPACEAGDHEDPLTHIAVRTGVIKCGCPCHA